MRYALTAIFLMLIWLLMSGIYTPLILTFGGISAIAVALIGRRMDRVDNDHPEFHLNPMRYFRYFVWLMIEIARSNWVVTKIILAPRLDLRQHLFLVPATQKTDMAQVTFANSITLTPGTITVETEPDRFLVHALDYTDETPGDLADMDRRVSAVETKGAG